MLGLMARSLTTNGVAMSAPILVGVDGTESGRDAVVLAAVLARSTDAPLIMVSVYPAGGRSGDREGPEVASATLEATREKLADLLGDLSAQFRPVASSSPARGLAETAEAEGVGMVVVGSHRSGVIGRVASGGTAERLLQGTSCPVGVAPRGYRKRNVSVLKHVGVAFIDTPEGHEALRAAADLAAQAGAALTLYSVVGVRHTWFIPEAVRPEEETIPAEVRMEYQDAVDRALAGLPSGLTATGEVLYGDVVEELSLLGERGVDLLVSGSRGYGPVRRVLLGTVSSSLVRQSSVPVLVVPRGESERH
jgi:nucleotide-binding universal stress UspA family protein